MSGPNLSSSSSFDSFDSFNESNSHIDPDPTSTSSSSSSSTSGTTQAFVQPTASSPTTSALTAATASKTGGVAQPAIKEFGRLKRAAEWIKNQFVAKKLSPDVIKSFGNLDTIEKVKVTELKGTIKNMVKGRDSSEKGATVMKAGELDTWVAKDSEGRAHGMGSVVTDSVSTFNTKKEWNEKTQQWDTTKEKTGEFRQVITGKFKHGQLVGKATRESYRITDPEEFQNKDPLHQVTSEPSRFSNTVAIPPKAAPAPAPDPASAPAQAKAPAQAAASAAPKEAIDKGKYVGETKDGVPHGKGTMQIENGDVFEGTFADGKFVYGTKTDTQRNQWEGSFNDEGHLEGQGVYRGSDYSFQTGNFKDGKLDGYGTTSVMGGAPSHKGLYVDGKHVAGTDKIIVDNESYTKFYGTIARNSEGKEIPGDGKGILVSEPTDGSRTITSGTLKDSKWVGDYTRKYDANVTRPGGLSYEINMASEGGRPATLTGSIVYPANKNHIVASYSGSFDVSHPDAEPPIPHGAGMMVFDNGDVLKCNFTNGLPDGTGTLQSNGVVKPVKYQNGLLVDKEIPVEVPIDDENEVGEEVVEENPAGELVNDDVQMSRPPEDGYGTELEAENEVEESPPFTFEFSVGGNADGGKISPDPIKENSEKSATLSQAPNEATEKEPYKFPDGGVYVGKLENNLPNGWGKSTSAKGTVFEGEFRNGALNGYGKMSTTNGFSYEGEFKNNQLHGKGTLVSTGPLKTVIKDGDFVDGKFLGGTTAESKDLDGAQRNLYGPRLQEKLEAKNARFEKAKVDVENKTKNP